MAVELAGIPLQHLTEVSVKERARIVQHVVPGMSGDLAQMLGRPSVEVFFRGIFYGETAAEDLKQLRNAYLAYRPVDFFTEAVGEGYFSRVLISKLGVSQRAGFPDQFDFVCEVVEYVEPPEPVAADPFPVLDEELLREATLFIDDVQNTLEQASQLTDLIVNVPSFGDPTELLHKIPNEFVNVVNTGLTTLKSFLDLF